MATNNTEIEKRLWEAADELRANSKLKSSEYSTPVLGLIFLRYADHKFTIARQELEGKSTSVRTCDLLLPKLISGEMDVEKINILMPDNGGA
ncbi:MAG: type I restriction-modification system subunit M N-terminal domain-containing protein [ANME-2 cluster archaeon]|nr:type I restriction-modification system subunit M N-terminal domain-containing protein [ANME-2 cluster archaeon]